MITELRLRPIKLSTGKRSRDSGSVREFLVHWAPETCSYLEVQKQRAAGFRTLSIDILNDVCDPELDSDDVASPCHICKQGAGDQTTGPPLFQCERCSHWLHAHCLPNSPDSLSILTVPVWTCPDCRPATPQHPVPLQLCRVQWAPEWQGEKHIRSMAGGRTSLDLFLAQRRPPDTTPPTPLLLPPGVRPARWAANKRTHTLHRPRSPPPPQPTPLTHNTRIILDEFDPDRDAPPTGTTTAMLAPGFSTINPSSQPAISVHAPDGRPISPKLLTPERCRLILFRIRFRLFQK